MAKKIILAVAGSGKTHYICNYINQEKKNLILAFTHENINNIRNELVKRFTVIPNLTTVMTFDSFIYRFMLCPYEASILQYFKIPKYTKSGITMLEPPKNSIKRDGEIYHNPSYQTKDKYFHYATTNRNYYCSRLSELIMQVKINKCSLIKRASSNLNAFYDQVLIDEFQDFREFDYKLIVKLAEYLDDILLVGDFYQHSVSATNNSGRPFKIGNNFIAFEDFKKNLEKNGFTVDDKALKNSRRCSKDVCDFVREKLKIKIYSNTNNAGRIHWVNDNELGDSVLQNDSIMKLVFKNASKCNFRAQNWSYSKGNTMDSTCVILTDVLKDLQDESFDVSKITLIARNMLYVALTRTKGDLYIMPNNVFKKIKIKYSKCE